MLVLQRVRELVRHGDTRRDIVGALALDRDLLRLRAVVRQHARRLQRARGVEQVDVGRRSARPPGAGPGTARCRPCRPCESLPLSTVTRFSNAASSRNSAATGCSNSRSAQLGDLVGDRREPRVPLLRRSRRRRRRPRPTTARKARRAVDDQQAGHVDPRRPERGAGAVSARIARTLPAAGSGLGPSRGSIGPRAPAYDAPTMKGLILSGGAGTRAPADHPHQREAARAGRQQADPLLRHRGHGRGRDQGDRDHRRRHRRRDHGRGRRRLPVGRRGHLHPPGRAARVSRTAC